MTTIKGLLQTIKDATADLEEMLKTSSDPFAGLLMEDEAKEEVEDARNYDHFKDEQI